MKLKIQPVHTKNEIDELFLLVKEIWTEVFTPIIGVKQVEYMLKHYQSPKNITEEIANGAKYFILKKQDQSVGYTAYEENEEQIYLSKLYLSETQRGQGLSSEIFNWYEVLAKGKTLHLNVNQGNVKAISVYEHRGFKYIGDRYVDIGEGFIMNDYIYEKKIDAD